MHVIVTSELMMPQIDESFRFLNLFYISVEIAKNYAHVGYSTFSSLAIK